jgi:hypothetical protein
MKVNYELAVLISFSGELYLSNLSQINHNLI